MMLCYLELFNRCVTAELYDLHTVQKRLRYSVCSICSAYEQYIRQIIRYIHIMICESVVLFRIQDLKQSTRRAPVVGCRELVHFIEDHDRIADTALAYAVHDTARHRSYICPAVSANI